MMLSTWDLCFDGNPPSSPVNPNNINNNNNNNNNNAALLLDSLTALHRYLPSNDQTTNEEGLIVDAFSCDHFRMYEFKVRKCARGRSHDWTECPYAHPGEKARRRDPRKYHYSGTACPDFRKGGCVKGDSCEFAHGVFECWLHPARYRTQPCKDGSGCRRRVCFFAHTPEQLRILPPSPGGFGGSVSSPTSILTSPPVSPPSCSPPMSPSSPQVALSEVIASMRGLQLGKMRIGPRSPRMQGGPGGSPLVRHGLNGIPSSPTWTSRNIWEMAVAVQEEPAMERVESGRDIRARMYAKLSKDYSLEGGAVEAATSAPDFGWVVELVK